jgi:hypothetical protein
MRASLVSILATVLAVVGCDARAPSPSVTQPSLRAFDRDGDDPNPGVLFERDARPYGHSLERWSERAWQWVYAIPAAHNPFLDLTGVDCAVNQEGPVWFLPSVIDPGGTASFTRHCTLPHRRALLLNLSGVLNDFPCPDPTFHPAPGQSLYDFLAQGAKQIVDGVIEIDVTLDGTPLHDMLSYRVTSDDLFRITGDVSLQTSLDGCITGTPQPAVSDAYFIMFRPLDEGAHVIVARAVDNHGTDVTLTYDLTLQ